MVSCTGIYCIVQYSFKSGKEHPIPKMPHGNSHHTVSSSLGGLHSCTSVGQVPRSRQQVSDMTRNQKDSKNNSQNNISGKGTCYSMIANFKQKMKVRHLSEMCKLGQSHIVF